MAAAVVDGLEVVDVDQEQSERCRLAIDRLELARELVLERAMVAEPGQAVEQGVEAGAVVQLDQLVALRGDGGRVPKDRATLDRHERGQGNGRDDQDEGRGPAPLEGIGRPEPLDGRHAHQDGERQQEARGQPDADRVQPPAIAPRGFAQPGSGHGFLCCAPEHHLYAAGPLVWRR